MAVKARAIRQAEVDAREAAAAEEREQQEAEAKVRSREITHMRLTLWLMRYVWPRLTTEEKAEVREIIPDEMETEIKTALSKLP
jgi:hypothetical protein